MTAALDRTFASLRVPNYRRFFAGQVVSISGNWMQIVAEMWLIVQLTGSGTAVGIAAGLQFLPMLLLGSWGGVLADRLDKRRLLTITQTLMVIPARHALGAHRGRADRGLDGVRARARPRLRARLRQSRAPGVRERDRRPRPRRQRRRAQLGRRPLQPDRRPRRRGRADRARRRVRVLRGQRRDVRGDARRPAADGPGAAPARRARAARGRPGARRASPTCGRRPPCASRWR